MRNLLHIILASLVYISSMGLVINRHYCQEQLKGVSIFIQPETCHSKKDAPVCPFHQKAMQSDEEENNCCNNRSELIKEDPETPVLVQNTLQVPDLDFELSPVVLMDMLTFDLSLTSDTYLTYKPPIVKKDISVLFQSFLI